jgi:hypothetical protein
MKPKHRCLWFTMLQDLLGAVGLSADGDHTLANWAERMEDRRSGRDPLEALFTRSGESR